MTDRQRTDSAPAPRTSSPGNIRSASWPPSARSLQWEADIHVGDTVRHPFQLQAFNHARDGTPTMSDSGLVQDTSVTALRPDTSSVPAVPKQRSVSTQTSSSERGDAVQLKVKNEPMQQDKAVQTFGNTRRRLPLSFAAFVEQRRLQEHWESRRRSLERRRTVLQKTITLSSRLHRLNAWIRDGLVEISKHADAAGFVRVHQHIQDLVDISYSQWNQELHAIDVAEASEALQCVPDEPPSGSFLSELPATAQTDLFALVSCLRSDCHFLLERFRLLSNAQITALSTFPRFSDERDSAIASLRPGGRQAQRRVKAFAKQLEDYATSFERSNPLSFLLFNIYGTEESIAGSENQLRIHTWSTVCAELMLTCDEAYQALFPQLLSSFATMHDWRIKDSLELFLMDILQKGAFLLDLVGTENDPSATIRYDLLATPQAQEFFDQAILDLFAVLSKCDGGFPAGALHFARAVLAKLPLEYQMKFRGEFFMTWFVNQFLFATINHPENENMLLKFHVSSSARDHILYPLWEQARARVIDMYSPDPAKEVHPAFQAYVETMISALDAHEAHNPYLNAPERPQQSAITMCASEVVQALDALSPQTIHGTGLFEHFLTSSTSTFHAQFPSASGRFYRLRRELIRILEPGTSSSETHPCQEKWAQLRIDDRGEPTRLEPPTTTTAFGEPDKGLARSNLDEVQHAALRACRICCTRTSACSNHSYQEDLVSLGSLQAIFARLGQNADARADVVSKVFWDNALEKLASQYPLSVLAENDAAALKQLFEASCTAQLEVTAQCSVIESEISALEQVSGKIRSAITKFNDRIEELRLKSWYFIDVINSQLYTNAKTITQALNNMALSIVKSPRAPFFSHQSATRPTTSRSQTSSIFEQPLEDTMNLLKAPTAHGGPKKLADAQIETTKKWLQRSNVDNFCRGEERIHRFCMEVDKVARDLVGESIAESPVLWSSQLFTRERSFYDTHAFGVTSAPASTRPASVMSETYTTSLRSAHLPYRLADGSSRGLLSDDGRSVSRRISIHSAGPSRINRDFLVPELASSIGSFGRAHSATTADSISSLWSPHLSHTRSLTAASSYSRPASTFNDLGLNRFSETAREKAKFLEKVRQTLVCLLLSDLGCPVWSMGSETDAWLESARNVAAVDGRLQQRSRTEDLTLSRDTRPAHGARRPQARRSSSLGLETVFIPRSGSADPADRLLAALDLLLVKMTQQADPIEKLDVVKEFHDLAIEHLRRLEAERGNGNSDPVARRGPSQQRRRRTRSLDVARAGEQIAPDSGETTAEPVRAFAEKDVVRHLKTVLLQLRPRTLFRDLQYIAAFVPSELADKTARGEALLRVGLAILAYKDEVCRSLIDVADSIVSCDATKRRVSTECSEPLTRAVEFYMFAAREGHAVAQRELALLYLSHPQTLSVVTLPLSISAEIFKDDMVWHERDPGMAPSPALCLALHWMQQAARNGDTLAQQKLHEREGATKFSLR